MRVCVCRCVTSVCPHLGGPFVKLHCLGSGIHFELLGPGFLRTAWIIFASYLHCLRKLKKMFLDSSLAFVGAGHFVFHDSSFPEICFSTKEKGEINRRRQPRKTHTHTHRELLEKMMELRNEFLKLIY